MGNVKGGFSVYNENISNQTEPSKEYPPSHYLVIYTTPFGQGMNFFLSSTFPFCNQYI